MSQTQARGRNRHKTRTRRLTAKLRMNHRGKRWITELEGVSQEALHKAASEDPPCTSRTIETYPVCRKALLAEQTLHIEERTNERKDYSNCREVLNRRTGHFCDT